MHTSDENVTHFDQYTNDQDESFNANATTNDDVNIIDGTSDGLVTKFARNFISQEFQNLTVDQKQNIVKVITPITESIDKQPMSRLLKVAGSAILSAGVGMDYIKFNKNLNK